jgi:hypothetical protein
MLFVWYKWGRLEQPAPVACVYPLVDLHFSTVKEKITLLDGESKLTNDEKGPADERENKMNLQCAQLQSKRVGFSDPDVPGQVAQQLHQVNAPSACMACVYILALHLTQSPAACRRGPPSLDALMAERKKRHTFVGKCTWICKILSHARSVSPLSMHTAMHRRPGRDAFSYHAAGLEKFKWRISDNKFLNWKTDFERTLMWADKDVCVPFNVLAYRNDFFFLNCLNKNSFISNQKFW